MLDPAGASTLGASTRWDQRVSAPAVGTDDADADADDDDDDDDDDDHDDDDDDDVGRSQAEPPTEASTMAAI